ASGEWHSVTEWNFDASCRSALGARVRTPPTYTRSIFVWPTPQTSASQFQRGDDGLRHQPLGRSRSRQLTSAPGSYSPGWRFRAGYREESRAALPKRELDPAFRLASLPKSRRAARQVSDFRSAERRDNAAVAGGVIVCLTRITLQKAKAVMGGDIV